MHAIRLSVAALATLGALALTAEAREPLKTKPAIALAMPMADVPEGVGIEFPVAINTTTILTPSDILRIIYVPLTEEDARVVKEQRLDEREVAYTRHHQLRAQDTEEDQLTPGERALLKMIRETHWPNKKMFMLALTNQPGADLRIVHADRNSNELKDSAINLPDGLLVGSTSGVLKVLAVEEGSRAEKAGMKANDIILQVGDQRMGDDLSAFLTTRSAEAKKAKLSAGRQYVMIVQNIEEDAPRQAVFKLPPSLSTGFMDEPILMDEPEDKDKPALPSTDVWRDTKPKD